MPKYKTYFHWIRGKDYSMALHYLLKDQNFSVDFLLTTINQHHQRVNMHGLKIKLLELQLKAIGIPYGFTALPEETTNKDYEKSVGNKMNQFKEDGFKHTAFSYKFL